ncbi:hypothetical protein BJ973_003078 [Actinoplanes tereljensis]|uniref:hypothetical protein n=1 Tax=Paractinoplanes tereljensis TaxID=571912 RepID=UPI0019405D17|nr:hypothetical protein [Actinoplanes tereljensis]
MDGLELVRLDEEDAEGPAYCGTKHWHVFDVLARASARATARASATARPRASATRRPGP